jgi:hypothetical protein
LEELRGAAIRAIPEITWKAAGMKLLEAYRRIINRKNGGA